MNQCDALPENKKKIIVCYVLLMLGTGVWQLADWYFGKEDPLWHPVFFVGGHNDLYFACLIHAFKASALFNADRMTWSIS